MAASNVQAYRDALERNKFSGVKRYRRALLGDLSTGVPVTKSPVDSYRAALDLDSLGRPGPDVSFTAAQEEVPTAQMQEVGLGTVPELGELGKGPVPMSGFEKALGAMLYPFTRGDLLLSGILGVSKGYSGGLDRRFEYIEARRQEEGKLGRRLTKDETGRLYADIDRSFNEVALATPGQRVVFGGGQLAGFVKSPLTKAAYGIAGKIPGLQPVLGARRAIPTFFSTLGRNTVGLSLAFGLHENTGIDVHENLVNRAIAMGEGGTLGAVFGSLGQLNLAAHPHLSRIMRIGTGSALLDAIQGRTPWDERALQEKAFSYGLYTYLFYHGANPREQMGLDFIKGIGEEASRYRNQQGQPILALPSPQMLEARYADVARYGRTPEWGAIQGALAKLEPGTALVPTGKPYEGTFQARQQVAGELVELLRAFEQRKRLDRWLEQRTSGLVPQGAQGDLFPPKPTPWPRVIFMPPRIESAWPGEQALETARLERERDVRMGEQAEKQGKAGLAAVVDKGAALYNLFVGLKSTGKDSISNAELFATDAVKSGKVTVTEAVEYLQARGITTPPKPAVGAKEWSRALTAIGEAGRLGQERAAISARRGVEIPGTVKAAGADPTHAYEFKYRVLSLDDVIASHTETLAPNPLYPRDLQPRFRERAASDLQVDRIASQLEPDALLDDVHTLDRGPMIVGPDNIVESGNGRILALKRARTEYPERWAAYQGRLREVIAQMGVPPAELAILEDPVLVRERLTSVDRVEFSAEANAPSVLSMAPSEFAIQDAGRVTDDALSMLQVGETQGVDQALSSASNKHLVRQFLQSFSPNERAAFVGARGQLNQVGLQRLKAAIFASTYPGEPGQRLIRSFIESLDPTIKSVENAMFASLPRMGQAEGLVRAGLRDRNLSIGDDISRAVDMLARLRQQGTKLADYLGQQTMFQRDLTPFQESLLRYLHEHGRSPRRLRGFFNEYAGRVQRMPPKGQGALFEMAAPTKEGIAGEIIERQKAELEKAIPLLTRGAAQAPEGAPAPTPRPQLEGPTGRGGEAGFVRLPGQREVAKVLKGVRDGYRAWTAPSDRWIREGAIGVDTWAGGKNLGRLHAHRAAEAFKKLVPNKKEREQVTFWRENPERYADEIARATPGQRALLDALREAADDLWILANDDGIVSGWRDNYVPHIWKNKAKAREVFGSPQAFSTFFAHAKERKLSDIEAGMELGLRPVLDPADYIQSYIEGLYRATATTKLVEYLSAIRTDDGTPIIVGEKGGPGTEDYIITDNPQLVEAFGRWRFHATKSGTPMGFKGPVYLHRDIAKMLTDIVDPFTPPTRAGQLYRALRGKVKRFKMANPTIHGWNIYSDLWDECDFSVRGARRLVRRGRDAWDRQDKLVEEAITKGNVNLAFGERFAQTWMDEAANYRTGDAAIDRFIGWLFRGTPVERWLDKQLWSKLVLHGQLGMYEMKRDQFVRGGLPLEEAQRAAGVYTNILLGTIPNNYLGKTARRLGNTLLFARNWTFSNYDMLFAKTLFRGKGLGSAMLNKPQRKKSANHFTRHIVMGIFMYFLLDNFWNYAFNGHSTLDNEEGHLFDVKLPWKGRRGETMYLVPPYLRYIRDYLTLEEGLTTLDFQFVFNKAEPLLMAGMQLIQGERRYGGRLTPPEELPFPERAKEWSKGAGRLALETLTPIGLIPTRRGLVPTPTDRLAAAFGMWIRRGRPGGIAVDILKGQETVERYYRSKDKEEFSVLIQQGRIDEAADFAVEKNLYKTRQGLQEAIFKAHHPLLWYVEGMSRDELRRRLAKLSPEDRTTVLRELDDAETVSDLLRLTPGAKMPKWIKDALKDLGIETK